MKKNLLSALFCLMLCAAVLVGCGGNQLAGSKWKIKEYTVQGISVDLQAVNASLEFPDDTTAKMSMAGVTMEGTYTDNGDTVSIEFLGQTIDFQREGNLLKGENEGQVLVFEKEE